MESKNELDYRALGLKCGLEIHFQLNTRHKLFCKCSTKMERKEPASIVKRKLHPVASELGEIDRAAQFEYLRDRTFYYLVFEGESCLVELDEEPPHEVNEEALEVALKVALLFNCKIPDEIHVMRKTVIDGSNPSGFQRTMVVGRDGWFEYEGRRIEISTVCLEEDAAAIEKEENGKVYYRLNRLGIPLVEVSTGLLEGFTPSEIQEIAERIGMIVKSTGKVRRGIGSIRQDVNVSIEGGARVEIKGVQELGMLSKVVELEVKRQLELIRQGKEVKEETRAALPDGTTRYTRPLPGAARMYPECDIEPISIERERIEALKKSLPETLDKKLERFVRELNLPQDMAREIIRSPYLDTFEMIVKEYKVDAKLVARTLTQTLKDLKRREKARVENLREEHFFEVFDFVSKGKMFKEAIPEVLKYLCENPQEDVETALEKLSLKPLSKEEVERIARELIEGKELPFGKALGIVMSKVRGRTDVGVVREVVQKILSETR